MYKFNSDLQSHNILCMVNKALTCIPTYRDILLYLESNFQEFIANLVQQLFAAEIP